MPIFNLPNNKNVLFVHIPKNGGTSIEQSFSNFCMPKLLTPGPPSFLKVSPQHLTLDNLSVLGFSTINFDYSFSIVRDPYKRLESEYFYSIHLKYGKLDIKNYSIGHVNYEHYVLESFSDWVINNLNAYKLYKNHADNHFIPQSEFIDNSLTDIFKFEDGIESILNKISTKIGISLPPEHRFKTDKFPIEWSTEAIQLTNEIYKNDFIMFDYGDM